MKRASSSISKSKWNAESASISVFIDFAKRDGRLSSRGELEGGGETVRGEIGELKIDL